MTGGISLEKLQVLISHKADDWTEYCWQSVKLEEGLLGKRWSNGRCWGQLDISLDANEDIDDKSVDEEINEVVDNNDKDDGDTEEDEVIDVLLPLE